MEVYKALRANMKVKVILRENGQKRNVEDNSRGKRESESDFETRGPGEKCWG